MNWLKSIIVVAPIGLVIGLGAWFSIATHGRIEAQAAEPGLFDDEIGIGGAGPMWKRCTENITHKCGGGRLAASGTHGGGRAAIAK